MHVCKEPGTIWPIDTKLFALVNIVCPTVCVIRFPLLRATRKVAHSIKEKYSHPQVNSITMRSTKLKSQKTNTDKRKHPLPLIETDVAQTV